MSRIYDRPDLDQRRSLPALYVTGTLPKARPGIAYEGRLQIHNAVGACSVQQIDGDQRPPGSIVTVDNTTSEVLIAWPAYVEQAAPIQNPGFEDGVAGWSAGAGWAVTTNNAIAGTRSAVYERNGGTSVLSSQSRYPVNQGMPISAECLVRQGASSAGNAGAGVRLEFRDATGAVIDYADGNYVMSASKNAVYPSNVTARPPQNTATVNVAGVGVRHRENKDVWIDSFSWSHTVAAAGMIGLDTFDLTLVVRDSAGRSVVVRATIGNNGLLSDYDVKLISKSPWGYWRLNELQTVPGAVAEDVSGNDRHALFNSTGTWSPATALFGGNTGSVVFAGTGVKCPSQAGIFSNTTKISAVAWIKTSAFEIMQILSSDSSAATYRFCQFRVAENGKLQAVSYYSSQTISSVGSVNDGNAHLVAFVYDPTVSNADGRVKLYIDGVLDTKSTGGFMTGNGTAVPAIGARSNNEEIVTDGFIGNISNAALFIDVALTASDIAELWAARNS